MIEFEHTKISGWEAALRGMRNPKNSWDKSDSYMELLLHGEPRTVPGDSRRVLSYVGEYEEVFHVGPNDEQLMRQLCSAGSDHAKFMRMITVTTDITAPIYWWKEFDTYKVGTVRNSCSTMHKLTSRDLEFKDFSHERLTSWSIEFLGKTIDALNDFRKQFNQSTDALEKKQMWYQLIQLLPSSYNQKATVQVSYEMLHNARHSREGHKLGEWRVFCDWCDSLPYSWLLTMDRHSR